MALNGTIKGTTGNDYISAKIEWTATQSISGNYSDVTATLSYSRTNTGYTTYGTWSGSITINGTKTSGSKSLEITYNSNTKALTATTRVYHNNDGSKSITISASGQMSGTSLTSTSVSGTITLNTIPRSSSLSLSTTSVNVGSNITASISRASSSFTHTVEFYINDTYYKKYTDVGTSQSYTIPTDWYSAMPSSSSCTAYCRITTYNSGTQIGSQTSKSFTVNVPDNICPSISSNNIVLSPVSMNTSDGTSRSILVKGKNKLSISVSGCKPGEGSAIKSYTFSGQNISSTTTATSLTSSSVINPSMSEETVTLKYTVTVTDNRGRTASAEKSITCYNYSGPTFKSFKSYRSDSSGNATNDGSHLKCEYKVTYYAVNNTNKIYSFSVSGTDSTNITYSSWTTSTSSGIVTATGSALVNLNGNTTTTYNVYGTVVDNYGGSKNSSKSTVHGAFRIMNITKDGSGFAIGKMAESSDLFDCKHAGKFRSTLNASGNITTDGSFGSSSTYNNNNFATYCQWADGKNHDVLVRSTDGLTVGLGWVGSDTYPTVLDVRPKTVSVRGDINASGNICLKNNKSYRSYKPDGTTDVNVIQLSSSNNVIIGSNQNNDAGLYTYGVYDNTTSSSANMFISSGHRLYRSSSSSRRYKTNIENVQDDKLLPEKLYELPVHEFKYKDGYLSPTDKNAGETVIGFIAEEIDEIYPIACEYLPDGSPENWNIRFMVPAMLKLIQDQKKEIDMLTATVSDLQEKLKQTI